MAAREFSGMSDSCNLAARSNDTVCLHDSCNSACGSVYDVTSCTHIIYFIRTFICAVQQNVNQ